MASSDLTGPEYSPSKAIRQVVHNRQKWRLYGGEPCDGSDFKEAADEIERLRAALAPFASLKIPYKPVGNAGAYSLRFKDIERAQQLTN